MPVRPTIILQVIFCALQHEGLHIPFKVSIWCPPQPSSWLKPTMIDCHEDFGARCLTCGRPKALKISGTIIRNVVLKVVQLCRKATFQNGAPLPKHDGLFRAEPFLVNSIAIIEAISCSVHWLQCMHTYYYATAYCITLYNVVDTSFCDKFSDRMYIHVYIHVCIHVCIHTYMYIYTCIYI